MEMMRTLAWFVELQEEKIANWMVVVMGIGTVFVGLICIVVLCKIMGLFFLNSDKNEKNTAKVTAVPAAQSAVIENRQEIIAAVTAAAAEEMGKDVSAIRVISFKKL